LVVIILFIAGYLGLR